MESSAVEIARLIDNAMFGTLATVDAAGQPFASLVNFAHLSPIQLILLLSGLAWHTRNLHADSRCSLLVASLPQAGVDPLTATRVTYVGQASRLTDAEDEKDCFLRKHPSSAMYAGFGDFAFYRIDVREAHLVAGFGRIQTLAAKQLVSG